MIAGIISGSLGPWSALAEQIARIAEQGGVLPDAFEASAGGGDGGIRGGRMMIERVDARTARALLELLPVPVAPALQLIARGDGVPLITGWDTQRPAPVSKIYLNLSDASERLRTSVATSLGLSGAPHVIGMNTAADGVERKVYRQLEAWPDDAPARLNSWARNLELAGIVQSFDVDHSNRLAPRAMFVAPCGGQLPVDVLATLPGWNDADFAAAIPYAWGQVRSVGFSHAGSRWVVYVKPRHHAAELWSLEPEVCVRCQGGELGIYLAPHDSSERAYTRTARHALSYRVREGMPTVEAVTEVMDWARRIVAHGEMDGANGKRNWIDPPRGCHVVER